MRVSLSTCSYADAVEQGNPVLESKAYHRMLIINTNSSLKFHGLVGIVSKLNTPVSEPTTGQRSAPQKGMT